MGIMFTNNAEGTLAGPVEIADTTLTLTGGQGVLFPVIALSTQGDWFYATIVDTSGNREIVKVTQRVTSTDEFQTMERAQDNTTARDFAAGSKVQIRLPAIVLEEIWEGIDDNAADILTNGDQIAQNYDYFQAEIDDITGRLDGLEANLTAPSGLKMYFYEDDAPYGWTYDAAVADKVLAVKGGSNDYNVSGGNQAGSWTPTAHLHEQGNHQHNVGDHRHYRFGHEHTGPSHVHTMGTHTHTMNTHNHQWYKENSGANDQSYNSAGTAVQWDRDSHSTAGIWAPANNDKSQIDTDLYTNKIDPGDTNAKDPGDTNAGGTEDTGSTVLGYGGYSTQTTDPGGSGSNTANNTPGSSDRPYAAVGIIGTKD